MQYEKKYISQAYLSLLFFREDKLKKNT